MRQNQYKQTANHILYMVVFGLVSVTMFSAILLASSTANADTSATVPLSIAVTSACSFSSGGGEYSATILNGQTSTITGNAITTSCNDAAGYAVYAVGYSDDTYSGTYHTDMRASIGDTYNIKTDGTGTNSYWKMRLTNASNAIISGSYGSFQVIPGALTEVAKYNSNTANGSITPEYQVYIGATQISASYTGKVKYVLVHPNTMVAGTYSIAYNANGGSGSMTGESGLYNFNDFTLPASTITKNGYIFLGWCTVNPGSSDTCSGTTYADEATIPASTVANGGTLTLYAIWQEIPKVYMQDLTSSAIATLLPSTGDTATVYDRRDVQEQEYTIAKLADGKYWMVTNLNLAGGTALSADDTDVTSAYISSFSTSNNLTKSDDTLVLPASSTSGFNADNYSYVYNSGNTTNCGASGQNTPCYSYYSWDAATLGSGRSIATENTDAPYSICPKGWRLPTTYDGSGVAAEATDFRALMIGYGGSNSVQKYNDSTTPTGATMYGNIGPGTTPNFLLAGDYLNGYFYEAGSYGYFWSATARSSSSTARAFAVHPPTAVNSASSNNRRIGHSVRCIFGE